MKQYFSLCLIAVIANNFSKFLRELRQGFVEGLNNKIRVIQRRSYGLWDEEYLSLKVLTCMLDPT